MWFSCSIMLALHIIVTTSLSAARNFSIKNSPDGTCVAHKISWKDCNRHSYLETSPASSSRCYPGQLECQAAAWCSYSEAAYFWHLPLCNLYKIFLRRTASGCMILFIGSIPSLEIQQPVSCSQDVEVQRYLSISIPWSAELRKKNQAVFQM